MDQRAVFAVPLHRAREYRSLDIGATTPERLRVVAVRDPDHVLFDDRPVVEHLGYVVRRRADQLDAALPGPFVGLGTREGRQERVMDVDHRDAQALEKPVGSVEYWSERMMLAPASNRKLET